MDKHFSDILNTFKRLDEMAPQGMKAVAISDPQTGKQLDYLDVDTAAKKYGFNPQDVAKQLQLQAFTQMKGSDGKTYTVQKEIGSTAFKPQAATPSQQVAQNQQAQTGMEEDTMAQAEKHSSGDKFGGYWKGTDKNPPRPGQGVGGCEESVEETIAREWQDYLREAGANNPAQGGGTQGIAQQKAAQQTLQHAAKTQTQIKSKLGTPPGVSSSNLTKAIAGAQPGQDITKLSTDIKKAETGLGDLASQFFNKASDADKNTVLQKMQQTASKPAGAV
jgi:hypothetical protein